MLVRDAGEVRAPRNAPATARTPIDVAPPRTYAVENRLRVFQIAGVVQNVIRANECESPPHRVVVVPSLAVAEDFSRVVAAIPWIDGAAAVDPAIRRLGDCGGVRSHAAVGTFHGDAVTGGAVVIHQHLECIGVVPVAVGRADDARAGRTGSAISPERLLIFDVGGRAFVAEVPPSHERVDAGEVASCQLRELAKIGLGGHLRECVTDVQGERDPDRDAEPGGSGI